MHKTVLTDHTMKTRYGNFINASPGADFRIEDVPESVRDLVPYARFWGISDDGIRLDLVLSAPAELTANLKRVFQLYDDRLDQWLSVIPNDPSDAYIAFSSMRMAALTVM